MTRIQGQHETRYVYSAASVLGPHVLRLRPREDVGQRLLSFDLRISPEPQGRAWGVDAEGNAFLQVWWLGETHHLRIQSQFEVELQRDNPFDFLVTDAASTLPLKFSEMERGMVALYLHDPGAAAVQSFAEAVKAESKPAPVDLLSRLALRIYGDHRQIVRETGRPLTPAETLQKGEASCRDFAVLFNAVCRCWGIPARFVSGYERAAALEDPGFMHAWSEVYLPGIGWRGFDPSRGLAVSNGHIAVAAARDPEAVTPIAGDFSGPGKAQMHYSVQLSEHA